MARICGLLATAFVCVVSLGRPISSFDTGWNVRMGDWIREHRSLPIVEPFLSTSHHPVIPDGFDDREELSVEYHPLSDHFHWLGQVLLSSAHQHFGVLGLMMYRDLLFVVALLGMVVSMRTLGVAFWWQAAAVSVAGAWLAPLALARPSVISMALVAVSSALWFSFWRNGSEVRAWLAVAMLPLWAQLHAGFILGQAVAGAFVVGLLVERFIPSVGRRSHSGREVPMIRILTLGAVAGLLPFLAHPTGWQRALSTLQAFADFADKLSPLVPSIEMSSPTWREHPQVFAFGLLILLFARRIVRNQGLACFFLCCGGLLLTLTSRRNASFLVLTALPIVTAEIANVFSGHRHLLSLRTLLPQALCLALVVNAGLGVLGGAYRWRIGIADMHPQNLADFLRRDPPPGLPFNVYNQGSFLVWQVPDVRWFVDGRFINARFLYEFLNFRRAQTANRENPAWRRWFAHYGIDWAVVPGYPDVPDIELIILLARSPDWRLVEVVDQTTVFVRDTAQTSAYLDRRQFDAREVQRGLDQLFPVVGGLAREAGALIAADFLVASGSFDRARAVLTSIPRSSPDFAGAEQRLESWQTYVFPVAAKLSCLDGGDVFEKMTAEMLQAPKNSKTAARLSLLRDRFGCPSEVAGSDDDLARGLQKN